jgi:predicted outer membrane lipoprotein
LLFDSRETSGPARLRYFDWVLGTLMTAGFSVDGAARAFSLLDSYIYGFGIEQFNMTADGDASYEEMAEALLTAVPPEDYPYLHQMASHAMRVGYDAEADFSFGLEIILDGLERILGEQESS